MYRHEFRLGRSPSDTGAREKEEIAPDVKIPGAIARAQVDFGIFRAACGAWRLPDACSQHREISPGAVGESPLAGVEGASVSRLGGGVLAPQGLG